MVKWLDSNVTWGWWRGLRNLNKVAQLERDLDSALTIRDNALSERNSAEQRYKDLHDKWAAELRRATTQARWDKHKFWRDMFIACNKLIAAIQATGANPRGVVVQDIEPQKFRDEKQKNRAAEFSHNRRGVVATRSKFKLVPTKNKSEANAKFIIHSAEQVEHALRFYFDQAIAINSYAVDVLQKQLGTEIQQRESGDKAYHAQRVALIYELISDMSLTIPEDKMQELLQFKKDIDTLMGNHMPTKVLTGAQP